MLGCAAEPLPESPADAGAAEDEGAGVEGKEAQGMTLEARFGLQEEEEEIEELFYESGPAPLWGRDSEVTVHLDTEQDGGVLSFEVDGVKLTSDDG